jgi:hypothetical protein
MMHMQSDVVVVVAESLEERHSHITAMVASASSLGINMLGPRTCLYSWHTRTLSFREMLWSAIHLCRHDRKPTASTPSKECGACFE